MYCLQVTEPRAGLPTPVRLCCDHRACLKPNPHQSFTFSGRQNSIMPDESPVQPHVNLCRTADKSLADFFFFFFLYQ